MKKNKDKISVVTVTYGKRWNFLSQVLGSVINNDWVEDIFVVNNGSEENIEYLCLNNFNSSKIKVINLAKNTGSAGGFNEGIKNAYENGTGEFIFLLDDDNVIEYKCLENLLSYYHNLLTDNNICLKALKIQNKSEDILVQKALRGEYLDEDNSFFNFHFKNFFSKKSAVINNSKVLPVRGVAYSGFFFKYFDIEKVGLPNKEMILYGDDTEYSLRFITKGYKIYLCLDCRIIDLDVSWHFKPYNGNPYLSPNSNLVRAYYGVRNRAYIEKKYLIINPLIYMLNFLIYTSFAFLKSLALEKNKKGVFQRFKIYLKALKNGWSEKLGEDYSLTKL